jgi:flagellar hook-associated protein 3 FlgL
MRITNSIITQNAINAMLTSQQGMNVASSQVTSGLRIQTISDAPTDGTQVMLANSQLRALAQYQKNVQSAQAKSDAQENALNSVSDLISRAQQLGIQQSGSGTATAQTRSQVQAEVNELLKSAVSLGNTKHNGGFLFGGTRPDVQPFDVSNGPPIAFTTTSPSGSAPMEITSGQQLTPVDDGTTIFGDTNSGVLKTLQDLSVALGSNNDQQIQTATANLQGSFDHVQNLIATTGARANQLQVTGANLKSFNVTLSAFKSSLQDVDMEKAITELVSKQTTYQAAMSATSKVLSLNLTSYL